MSTCCPKTREKVVRRRLSSVLIVILVVVGAVQGWYLKRISDERLSQDRRIETVVAASPVAMILCDENAKVTLFNPAAEELFGYKADELRGETVESLLLLPPYQARHAASFAKAAQALRANKGGWQLSSQVKGQARNKQGEEFDVIVNIRGIKYGDKVEFIAAIQAVHPEPPKIERLPAWPSIQRNMP